MLINLLPQPATVARSGGRQYGDPLGSEFVTLPPSGTVAVVSYDYIMIPTAEHIGVEGCYVDTFEASGPPRFAGLPTVPGHYLVSAQVCDALSAEQRVAMREAGVRLYAPRLLVFPGQLGHPGKDVLAGPFAPGLIRRV